MLNIRVRGIDMSFDKENFIVIFNLQTRYFNKKVEYLAIIDFDNEDEKCSLYREADTGLIDEIYDYFKKEFNVDIYNEVYNFFDKEYKDA